ncbi:helix-turn-helix domain-containing protein [Streptomyces mobaraensis NBRC 13819 = DSM 40847]|uniref:Helix-turn-helix domain-containing protein n=1 Tax=Streptomyces mobaraensis (strain ATCC 29032 / DSM 40847 / JCM 4168 / NBRC 13819 / NCIMB 11159 / IPCR 16-22) TaxID=1223523 RepID=M3AWY4_STRM1|nr:helix-turn-helix transcriptional regulator [Streptomyces mobaraensis]EME98102.1 helix-turn-helix domain-containing protein [Streptomyces mobaraensis NBRC 13819 = DSM 40847]QTT73860.1 helix-turn-helix domain-containing protein [Streptomyces mobaraensis NBRC 13819 = DSM 40847]
MATDTPSATGRRERLRGFLRSRRARLAPEDVGLPPAARRRTPGLRREEVALLAGVGVSWYTWLEQGRPINVSADVLDAIARALRLDEPEREHLYLLTGLNPPPQTGAARPEATPELRRLIEAWSPRPAVLLDRYENFVAVNDAARAVFGYTATDRNCLVAFFTNARYRALHTHWEAVAPGVVAAFRAAAARQPDDPGFDRIADGLCAASPEFDALWARHDVGATAQAVKAVRHPEVGELVFDTTTLVLPDQPGLHVELQNPRPGSGTAERLERLAAAGFRTPAGAGLVVVDPC